MHVSNRLLIVLSLLSATFWGCSDKSLNQEAAKVDVAFKIVADAKSDFAAVASTAEVKISAEGMPTLTQPLTVTSGGISGNITGIVAGSNRKFEVYVYDSANKLAYYGSSIGDVTAGGTANIAMTLYRTNGEGNAVINGTIESTNTPPTVSLTSPANNAQYTLGTTISLAATANDADGSVSSVSFYRGTTLLTTDNSAPYSYSYTPSAAGSYSFSAVATDNAGSTTTSATVSVTVVAVNQTSYKINCGGSASSPYAADGYYSGGSTSSTTSAITITGITNPAPAAVYQVERYGNTTYTFPNLVSGAAYNVRLHFAEIYWTASASRRFNVAINGSQVLSNFDIYATAGAAKKAVVREFTASANSSSQIIIALTTVTDNASICGIEIIPAATAPVITAQPVSQSGCVGSSATLSVVATGSSLSYQWKKDGISLSNSTNYSGVTTATLMITGISSGQSGSYTCTVTNGSNLSVTSNSAIVSVGLQSVNPTGVSISRTAPICSGSSITLTVTGGSLGIGASWVWYTNSSFVGPIGRASTISVSPTATTTYYVRAEGDCNMTSAVNRQIDVYPGLSVSGPSAFEKSCMDIVRFTVVPSGNFGYTYQWQISYDGGSTFTDCPETRYTTGVTTATLSSTPDQEKWFRCVVSDGCGRTVISSIGHLYIECL